MLCFILCNIMGCIMCNMLDLNLYVSTHPNFSEKGAGALADSLRKRKSVLCYLAIGDNPIGRSGGEALASAALASQSMLKIAGRVRARVRVRAIGL